MALPRSAKWQRWRGPLVRELPLPENRADNDDTHALPEREEQISHRPGTIP